MSETGGRERWGLRTLMVGASASLAAYLAFSDAPLAGSMLARHSFDDRRAGPPRAVMGAVFTGALIVDPLQVEAGPEPIGALERITLWGPALAAGSVLLIGRRLRRAEPAADARRSPPIERPPGSYAGDGVRNGRPRPSRKAGGAG